MYVRLGQIPSIVQPANPTPQNDAALYPAGTPSTTFHVRHNWPVQPRTFYASYPVQQTAIQPAPVPVDSQGASVTATVSANPGGLTAWLQTGNNGIYAAIGVAVLILLLTRRR